MPSAVSSPYTACEPVSRVNGLEYAYTENYSTSPLSIGGGGRGGPPVLKIILVL